MVRAADGSYLAWWLVRGAVVCAWLLVSPPAFAQRVTHHCSRLSDADWAELEARLRVLLALHDRNELGVDLRCDDVSAEVAVAAEGSETRLPLAAGDGLVEGTLAVVDAELGRGQSAAPEPSTPETAPVAAGPARVAPTSRAESPQAPSPPRAPAAPPPQRERAEPALSGGIGLGVAGETWGGEVPAFGPRLHLALGHADVCVVAVESLAFGSLERHGALTFSTELGAAWGAPYAPTRRFGAQVLLGHEWLSAAENEAAPSQTSGVWSVALGARAALPVGPLSLFAGPDLRFRLGRNELGPPLSLGLPSYSILVQAGVFWIQEAMPARR